MKKIAILGSTGSIGTQALDIVKRNRDRFRISALTCGRRTELLAQQIREFQPEIVCVEREEDALELKGEFPKTDVFWGKEGLKQTAALADCDMVLNGLVGMHGLEPTLSAIRAGRDIALANKETLAAGGNRHESGIGKCNSDHTGRQRAQRYFPGSSRQPGPRNSPHNPYGIGWPLQRVYPFTA